MFDGLRYPGHATVGLYILIGLLMVAGAYFLDQARVAAFGIAPVAVAMLLLKEAGLSWKTHKAGSLLLYGGYFLWLALVVVLAAQTYR